MALNAVKVVKRAFRRCAGGILKGSPPEPSEKVLQLLKSYKIGAKHLLQVYDVFHYLKTLEDEENIVVDAVKIEASSVKKMIPSRRKWLIKLLQKLLDLGQCSEEVTWDEFLWLFVRFCGLNRAELSQALFLLVSSEVKSDVCHYLTAQQLDQFYSFYTDCPFPAFNTCGIDFDKLPYTRYYPQDFAELTTRFGQLLNPALHLQRVIRSHVPGLAFWIDSEACQSYSRKITYDFFVIDTTRVHLRGEPAFRESCDLLLPEALGCKPINTDQWVLRTSLCREGQGLRQVAVWGEQPVPEKIEAIKRELAEEESAQRKREADAERATALAAAAAKRKLKLSNLALAAAVATAAPPPARTVPSPDGLRKEAWTPSTAAPPCGTDGGSTLVTPLQSPQADHADQQRSQVPAASPRGQNGRRLDAAALALFAATLDESGCGPAVELPPAWMRSATVAPAPQMVLRAPLRARPVAR